MADPLIISFIQFAMLETPIFEPPATVENADYVAFTIPFGTIPDRHILIDMHNQAVLADLD